MPLFAVSDPLLVSFFPPVLGNLLFSPENPSTSAVLPYTIPTGENLAPAPFFGEQA